MNYNCYMILSFYILYSALSLLWWRGLAIFWETKHKDLYYFKEKPPKQTAHHTVKLFFNYTVSNYRWQKIKCFKYKAGPEYRKHLEVFFTTCPFPLSRNFFLSLARERKICSPWLKVLGGTVQNLTCIKTKNIAT